MSKHWLLSGLPQSRASPKGMLLKLRLQVSESRSAVSALCELRWDLQLANTVGNVLHVKSHAKMPD